MIDVLLFLLGIHLTIVLFSSCYRIIDLWYVIADHAFSIFLRLFQIVSVICVTYFIVPASHETALLWGQIFYAGFHVAAYWLGVTWIKLRSRV